MRNIVKVIDKILLEIPIEDHSGLIRSLNWLKAETDYTPPELIPNLWKFGTSFIERVIPKPPVADWQWKVVSIWMDNSEEVLREMFK